ncbi:MAG: hypothetical protein V8Q28_04475 [Alistipes sp.]
MENRALGGHIISFSAGNTLFCRKRPRPDLSGEALAAPSPACVRSVVPRVDPFGFRIAPFGSCMIPLRPAPSLSRPVLTPARLPLLSPGARIIPLLFSRRSGNHSFRPAEPPRRLEQKNRLFFGVFVKFLLLLQYIAVTTLYPRRNGLHAASASLLTRGIPMTGDVPAAGSEQHTETIYL